MAEVGPLAQPPLSFRNTLVSHPNPVLAVD